MNIKTLLNHLASVEGAEVTIKVPSSSLKSGPVRNPLGKRGKPAASLSEAIEKVGGMVEPREVVYSKPEEPPKEKEFKSISENDSPIKGDQIKFEMNKIEADGTIIDLYEGSEEVKVKMLSGDHLVIPISWVTKKLS